MKHSYSFLLLLLSFIISPIYGQDAAQDLARIKTEGFQKSEVMRLVTDLSDLHGPRLTGTRQYYNAATWAKQTMEGWGLDQVYFEEYCNDCLGWEVHSFNVEMVAPGYKHLMAYPFAWTESSNGVQEAELVWIESTADMAKVKEAWDGKLKGKMVLMGSRPGHDDLLAPLSTRLTGDQIAKAESGILPTQGSLGHSAGTKTLPELLSFFNAFVGEKNTILQYLKEQGAIGILETANKFPGIVHPGGTYNYKQSDDQPIPYFAIAPEHFSYLQRLSERDRVAKIKFNLDSEMYLEPKNNVNIFGEIKGTDPKLKDEVVMIGAHFDSWHGGEGATDNGAGSAVMMEVMRILKASGIKPRRTIRVALWGGEEQVYVGSLAYAEKHFGPIGQEVRKKETGKISAYLNMDNGAGIMRGIYLQGNEAVRPIFAEMLKPFDYLDVDHLAIENTSFTDHDVFDYYNIPAFQIIQDELNYGTITHHTTLDVLENVPQRDMTVNATVIAGLVYQIAMRDEAMPRKQ